MAVIKFILIGLIGLYLLVGIGIYLFQEKIIFLPEKLPRDFQFDFEGEFEEHFIKMADRGEINLLHFKRDNPKGLILYFHGNAGSLERWGEVVPPFIELGYEVMIMDFRGYGKSSGKRSYSSMLQDADQVYEFALKFVEGKNLVVFGRSLGSSFASYLAGKYNPSKLILETPFYSVGDMARRLLPIYPADLLLRFNFKNHRSLKDATCSIYIFHGTDDMVVPFESGKKLFKTLDPDRSQLFVIEGGDHNNLASFEKYREGMRKILVGE